jgi:amino acid adenylation domain-containing protein
MFDLNLKVLNDEKKLSLCFNYNMSVFDNDTARRLPICFDRLLNEILVKPDSNISKLSVLSDLEKKFATRSFSKSKRNNQAGISDIFERSAKNNAKRIAIRSSSSSLSYQELNDRVNRLARALRKRGIKKGSRVGVLLPVGKDIVISMLAILKSGAIYVPLSARNPLKRNINIAQASDLGLIVTVSSTGRSKRLGSLFYLDQEEGFISNQKKENLNIKISPEQVAIIIHTSGSTGVSKGAMLKHSGIINHAFTKIDIVNMKKGDTISQGFSTTFVASIWQILSPLFIGASCFVYNDELSANPVRLLAGIKTDKITIHATTPSIMKTFLQEKRVGDLGDLKTIVLTGEYLPKNLVLDFYKLYKSVNLINAYGQSECSDDTLHYKIKKNKKYITIPIGKPINNIEVYILNQDMQVQPIGLPGEICISGDCLSGGYFNDSKKTDQVFLPHPFMAGKKIFKTGDMGRLNKDGDIEYLGRRDAQIKIRGNRIELEEIESVLINYKNIKDCAVKYFSDKQGHSCLVAFYVSLQKLSEEKMVTYLRKYVPEYMVPFNYVKKEAIPYTINGKIDRLKLSYDLQQNINYDKKNITSTEEKIIRIWQGQLKRKSISVNDNFFGIGGDSLSAVMVVNRINNTFKKKLSIEDFLFNPTIRDVVSLLH